MTALYEQATRQPVHRFRKPVRDQQARARRELQAECDRWLADLQAAALPTALTGQCEAAPVPPSTDVAALRSSLEQLRCAAGQSDPAEIRSAHKEAVTAYQQVQASLGFESFAHN